MSLHSPPENDYRPGNNSYLNSSQHHYLQPPTPSQYYQRDHSEHYGEPIELEPSFHASPAPGHVSSKTTPMPQHQRIPASSAKKSHPPSAMSSQKASHQLSQSATTQQMPPPQMNMPTQFPMYQPSFAKPQQQQQQQEDRFTIDDMKGWLEQKMKEMGVGMKYQNVLIELTSFRKQVEDARHDIAQRDNLIRNMEMERNENIARIEHLLHQDNGQKQLIAQLQDELSKHRNDQQSLDVSMDKLKKKNNALGGYVKQTVEQKNRLQEELQETKGHLVKAQEQIELLSKENERLQDSLSDAHHQISSLNDQVQHRDSADKQNMEAFQEIQQKYLTKAQELEELSGIQEELLISITNSKKEANDLKQQHIHITDENSLLRKENERQELLIQSLQNELKRSQIMVNDQREHMTSSMESREREYMKEVESLESQLQQLEGKYEELHVKYSEVHDKYQNQQKYISQLSEEQKYLLQISEEKKRLENINSDLTNKIEDLESDIQEKQSKIADLEGQVSSGSDALNQMTENRNEYRSNLEDAQREIKQLKKNVQELEGALSATKQEKVVERKVLHEEIHDLRKERDILNSTTQQLKQEKETIENELYEIRQEYENLQRDSSEEIDKLHARITAMDKQLKAVSGDKSSLVHQLSSISTELQETTSSLRTVEDELDQEKAKTMDLRQQLEDLSNRFNATQDELSDKVLMFDVLKQQHKELQELHEQSTTNAKLEIGSLLQMIKALKADISKRKELIERYEKQQKSEPSNQERELRLQAEQERDRLLSDIKSYNTLMQALKNANKSLEEKFKKNAEIVAVLEKKLVQVEDLRERDKRLLGSEIQHLRLMNQKYEKALRQKQQQSQSQNTSQSNSEPENN